MAEQKPIISIDHVSMRFNLSKEKHESLKEYFVALLHGGVRFDEFFALDDVSFDIMPGDFYGLIGLNGSGKSTLLKVISGVYKPSAGKVTVNGTIAPLIELGAGFDMDLTARENIYLKRHRAGLHTRSTSTQSSTTSSNSANCRIFSTCR